MTTPNQFPDFENLEVLAATLTMSGKITDLAVLPAEPLELDHPVVLIVRGVVTGVAHTTADGVVTRAQTVKASEAYIVPDGAAIMAKARRANEKAAERRRAEQTGQERLVDVPTDLPPAGELEAELPPHGIDRATGEIVGDGFEADVVDAELVFDDVTGAGEDAFADEVPGE